MRFEVICLEMHLRDFLRCFFLKQKMDYFQLVDSLHNLLADFCCRNNNGSSQELIITFQTKKKQYMRWLTDFFYQIFCLDCP